MRKLLFVINPKAGKTAIKDSLFDIIEIFSNAGYQIEVYPTKGPGDAEKVVRDNGNNYDLIVCAGGDGTLDNAATGYMNLENPCPLGYIPSGTTNDFARSLKIPRNPIAAAKSIVSGCTKNIDIGIFNDTYFIYVAAFGIFTGVSYSTPQNLKNVMGHSAYVLEGIRNILNYDSYEIEATFDGKTVSGEYIYGMITNSLSVGGFRALGTKYMSFDDGLFECILIKKPKLITEYQKIVTAILTNEIDEKYMFSVTAKKVEIKCNREIAWSIDGEFGGNIKEVVIENIPKALPIIVDENTYSNDTDF